MTMMKALLLTASAFGAVMAMPATATETWDGTGATDGVDMSQFGVVGTFVASGTGFTSTNGITGTFTTDTGNAAFRRNQGSNWSGNFAPGAPLLHNDFGNAGDLTFTFDNPVFGVGAQFQTNFFGDFIARILLNDGSFFDVNGNSNSNSDGSAVFVGAKNGVANISSITFHQQSGGGNNDFAIGNLSLLTDNTGAVPEPSTWAMMLIGFGALGAAMRRKARKPVVSVSYA